MQKALPTPKGFRDIQPAYAKKRREVINIIAPILEENGFVPLETPTLEFASTLTGKYGDEEKLIYKFTDRGDRELALRYDLTVPLARFITGNQNLLKPTFSRYQIGQVFRGENPQAGRYREFTQFDFDTVGPSGAKEDAKIIATAIKSVKKIGLSKAIMLLNDRQNFSDTPIDVIRAIDKIHKVGEEGVKKELLEKGLAEDDIENHLYKIDNSKPTENLSSVISLLKSVYGFIESEDFKFDPTLARGLDYYTGAIFEMKPSENPSDLTIGSGGRYDNLIGMFAGKHIQAVGFSFGLDRIVDLLLND
jgi:histidyl-tRNA synthetase